MKHIVAVIISLLFVNITFCQQGTPDETAIKQLLEKEAATWRSGDVKGHADCWTIKPYSRILVSTGDSNVLDIPPVVMINPPAQSVGQGGYAILKNIKMSIHGNDAWVSHDEESVGKDGKKSYSYEIRILEKENGSWKLVAQSIHIYHKRNSH